MNALIQRVSIVSITSIINQIVEREGGYINHPSDRGGATNFGITQSTLSRYRGHKVSIQDVKELTRQEAIEIYRRNYVVAPKFHKIQSSKLLELAVDSGVLHGTQRTTRWLQAIVGTREDGILGAVTLRAINYADPVPIYKQLLAIRIRFIGRLINRDRRQAAFAEGWAARLAEFVEK